MGSLALRPGDLLTIHEMALSIGFRIFRALSSCYSSYGALTFCPGGTFTHCSCQPSLDAHFPIPIWQIHIQSTSCQQLVTLCKFARHVA
jgi:hypothetical protein